jgi:hypothetical protein
MFHRNKNPFCIVFNFSVSKQIYLFNTLINRDLIVFILPNLLHIMNGAINSSIYSSSDTVEWNIRNQNAFRRLLLLYYVLISYSLPFSSLRLLIILYWCFDNWFCNWILLFYFSGSHYIDQRFFSSFFFNLK